MANPAPQPADHGPLFCARCAKELHPGTASLYVVNIEAFADPTPPEVSPEDLTDKLRAQIQQVIAELANVSEREALDQVYRRLTIHLCNACFPDWIENPAG